MNVLLAGLSTDRVELRLARALHENGITLEVITEPGSPATALCRERGIPFEEYAFRHRFDRGAVRLFRDRLSRQPTDVVHCLTNRALSTALRAVRRWDTPPKIVAYRGTMGHLSWFDPASHFSYLNRRVDGIICVSDAVRRYLKTFRIPDERLTVIWKGHDAAWYQRAPREALTALGIPADAVAVNFTGNIRPVKGVDYLLKAFSSIRPEENIHLLIIGEVRDKKIRRLIDAYPHVRFLGFRPDATALAGACDLAVMPSIEREGLPKAVLEAMAQGVPAVVSNVGGLPELVVDGECGLVIPPRDAGAIAHAVRMLASDADRRRRMGHAAQARVDGVFNFKHTVTKTLALYERLTGHS
jgi:glycosyltransferase involved in cell wall biosynthesis